MQVVLVMFRSDGERRSFSVSGDMTVIGRREDCDLRIPLGDVSRKHCRLIKDVDSLRMEDLGSSNGTFHNGQRVREATLQPGDSIQVGPVVFVVQIDGTPTDEELQPVLAGAQAESEEATAEVEAEAAELPADDLPSLEEAASEESAFNVLLEGGGSQSGMELPLDLVDDAEHQQPHGQA